MSETRRDADRCCSNPPAPCVCARCKTKSSSVFLHQSFFGGRGWTSRAAHLKKPRRGFFTRRTVRRVDAVRIHPCVPFFKADKTETPVPGSDTGVLGGRGWIRTTEAEKQQIYSLSPLATREHAQIQFYVVSRKPDDSFILAWTSGFVNLFFCFSFGFFHYLKFHRMDVFFFSCSSAKTARRSAGRSSCLIGSSVSGSL